MPVSMKKIMTFPLRPGMRRRFLAMSAVLALCVVRASSSANPVNETNKTSAEIQSIPTQSGEYQPPANIAELLNWVPNTTSVCGGSFVEPQAIREHPHPVNMNESTTKIHSEGTSTFLHDGTTILRDDVVATQPGRIVTADQAYIYRNPDTGDINRVNLYGNVHLIESGRLVVSDEGKLNINTNATSLARAVYQNYTHFLDKQYHAWGSAQSYSKDEQGITRLVNGTYSACNPTNPTWQMKAKKITLNNNTHTGVARDMTLRIKKIPVFYFPYYTFPLDDKRKSGFLMPSLSNGSSRGVESTLPYYWNMAPNYDAVLTPGYSSKRGFEWSTDFRYLTQSSHGQASLDFLPDDAEFKQYKEDTINEFSSTKPDYTDQMKGLSNSRAYINFTDSSKINDNWQANALINYVTDPYFFQDLSFSADEAQADQLVNQLDVDYTGMHWDATLLTQVTQTLHPINESVVHNQYQRLPELDVQGSYPGLLHDYDLVLDGQLVNFNYDSDFYPYTYQEPVGQRMHIAPMLTRSFDWAGASVTPGVGLDAAYYITRVGVDDPGAYQPTEQVGRVLPVMDLDAGMHFQREMQWGGKGYVQTLEPRLFYLYLPYQDQSNIPVYDTQLLPFSYNQLYSLNQYTGFDRIQNANQMSFGLTSRVTDKQSAAQKMQIDVGIIDYFTTPEVGLTDSGVSDDVHWSPTVAQLTFYPWAHVSMSGQVAWDLTESSLNNASWAMSYSRDGTHIAKLGYDYIHSSNDTLNAYGFTRDTDLIDVGAAWPVTDRWSTVGYWYYNISQQRPENYFFGLQYDSCCMTTRLIYNEYYSSTDPSSSPGHVTNYFTHGFYLQFMLKGLGGVGSSRGSSLLQSTLPGYYDVFNGE